MKPTCILSPPRSGSNFLNQILNKTCDKTGKVFEVFPTFKEKDLKCVTINNDHVSLAVSLIMAIETDFYCLGYGEQEVKKYEELLEFPPYDIVRESLLQQYCLVRNSSHELKRLLKDRPYIEFHYKEISQTPKEVVEKILEYSEFKGSPDWGWQEETHIFELNHPSRNEYTEHLREDVKTLFV
jgi:LPS sulfotransferase NodH